MRRAVAASVLLAACGAPEADGTANEIPVASDDRAGAGAISPAPGVYPFQGVWAGDGARCEDAGLELEDGPLLITTESVRYYDNPCAVEVVEELEAASAYAVTMSCAGEGMPSGLTQRFAVRGDTLTVRAADGGTARTYQRCQQSAESE